MELLKWLDCIALVAGLVYIVVAWYLDQLDLAMLVMGAMLVSFGVLLWRLERESEQGKEASDD